MADEDGGEDWDQADASQPQQAAPVSSREATPLESNAYPGSETADGEAADGDWQQYDDGDDDEDDGDDDKDEDYH